MDTPTPSHLNRVVQKLGRLRPSLRWRMLTWGFGKNVRFMRTARLQFQDLNEEHAVLYLRNRKRVQNHTGSVHAAAVALLAETASGTVLTMNLPDDRVPLLKSMQLDYTKRAKGDLLAEATLDAAARKRVRAEAKGEIIVPVTVSDESGAQPVQCRMLWAWISKSEPRSS
jgi:acyl-coenzyme A thioesterase PaaI-like protein